ncbi:NUDIX family hydrolase [Natrialba magadii ATCC 43099]|uniref:NUDIX family hydrolase n=1 Tax=Natrialba magadii (strain ATCC 43099 / DSM 3394 / CCM 3739 / CIP 104546 / IAM 13178 / JCM 8861 / NBRC 102185 / NCIMB 2190 / MS3) TaxID=547559 RepID=D3SUB0_NATMM|nr:NUDIX hydrolase [Natrialba magadii]ADD05168.1 NUDIX family hydrolase [Natrialba magadii ATCC 43099]ELY23206.1 NUDIX hydrolase [Natrialba magadii ATCC 43099]
MTTPDEWRILEEVTEYETPWYDGGYDLLEQPDGSEQRYYWAELPPAVVVVARVDGQVLESDSQSPEAEQSGDQLLFVEQYRPAIRETHLELPAGIVEEGESYTEAATRELEEETGFRPTSTVLLQEYAVATGVLRHDRGVVYADGLVPGERELDSNEFLEVTTVPVDRALERAREQPVNDSTLSALLLAREDGVLSGNNAE